MIGKNYLFIYVFFFFLNIFEIIFYFYSCERGEVHLHCLPKPIIDVPFGDWYCPPCCRVRSNFVDIIILIISNFIFTL